MSHQVEVVILYPIASMHGICTYIWLNCMVKVGKHYTWMLRAYKDGYES